MSSSPRRTPRVSSPRARTPRSARGSVASSEELADRARRSIEAHLARFAKGPNGSQGNASAAFASRSELFDRTDSHLRDMGDPGANGNPHEHLTLHHAAASLSSSFNRSSSAGELSFGTRLGRQQLSTPRVIANNPGPGTYEAKVLDVRLRASPTAVC